MVDLRSLIRSELDSFRTVATKRSILIDDPALPEIDCKARATPEDLIVCLKQLLTNALTFSEPGQLIAVALEPEPSKYKIVIRDEGPGVPDSERDSIFEAFVSVPRNIRKDTTGVPRPAELEGTGLGLYLARKIARRFGGDVTCQNRAGGGAEFTIELPRPIE